MQSAQPSPPPPLLPGIARSGNGNGNGGGGDEVLVSRARAYPVTATLLVLVCVASVAFGLLSTADQAAMLATGSASPVRVQLWREASGATAYVDAATATRGALHDTNVQCAATTHTGAAAYWHRRSPEMRWQDAVMASTHVKVGDGEAAAVAAHTTTATRVTAAAGWAWLWSCARWVSNFLWASIVAVSAAELLVVVAALWTMARDVERAMGVRRYTAIVVAAFAMRMVWFVCTLPLLGARVFACYTMRPGMGWLCIALYILHEYGPRHTGRPRKPPSRLRLFGKIPLGPELVRAVLLLHLLCRVDIYMGVLPGLVYGAVASSTTRHRLHLPTRRWRASAMHDNGHARRGEYAIV